MSFLTQQNDGFILSATFFSCFTKSLSKAIIGKKFQGIRSPPLKAPQLGTIFKGDDDGCGSCYVLFFSVW